MPRARSRVGDEEVVAHELDSCSRGLVGEALPAVPVVLGEAVFDGDDREVVDQLLVERDQVVGREARRGPRREVVGAVLVELGRGGVQREGDLLAGLVAGLLDGLDDELESRPVRLRFGREAALVADRGGRGRASPAPSSGRGRSRRPPAELRRSCRSRRERS